MATKQHQTSTVKTYTYDVDVFLNGLRIATDRVTITRAKDTLDAYNKAHDKMFKKYKTTFFLTEVK